MAGERLRLDGWTEISAVCTSPGHRGRGLASQLIGALVAAIELRSERVFLHVLSTNTTAIRVVFPVSVIAGAGDPVVVTV